MSKAKTIKKSFFLKEENGEVYAKLEAIGDYGIEMTIQDVPNVRVRAPRPSKEHLRGMAQSWAGDPMFPTSEAWLEDYAKGMNRLIIDELQDIRKSMKRIQSLTHCIKTAEKIIAEDNDKT